MLSPFCNALFSALFRLNFLKDRKNNLGFITGF
jgi:hypothetical protein